MPDSLQETDHLHEKFKVTTIHESKTFGIATDYELDLDVYPPLLVVWGDDDFEDGPIELRTFNMEHVVGYGWVDR